MAPTLVRFVPMKVIPLGTTYKWTHTVFALLCLAYFIERNVFKVHACGKRVSEFPSLFEAE